MNDSELDIDVLNEFQDNNEWDMHSTGSENWDEIQELIVNSNTVEEEKPAQEYLQVLHRCFGHQIFRPMQWKIINSIINERRDNCAIMATGYGKSLCFQFPSVYLGSITIVVSPLISLMEDQVFSLTMSNIPACLLGSAQTNKKQVIDDIFAAKYNLVYVTPEFSCGDYGMDLLKRINQSCQIVLIAIDEAHCVSSWGHDFRYQYRELHKLREALPEIPILAVTATATPKVRTDILKCLKLRNPQVLCSGFDRPNLKFSVYVKGTDVYTDLKKVMTDKTSIWGFPGSTIIYCITRKQTDEVTKRLKSNGVKCVAYHAGMSVMVRKEAHELFAKDKMKVIIATIAFGMGIDKPDVRNIIHYGASKDIESYYQEVGRAGRDGQPSHCITFFKNSDFDLLQTISELSGMSSVNRARREAMEKIMRKYLESRDCRRQFILNHFEGYTAPKKPAMNCCDNCIRKLQQTSDSNKYEGLNADGLYDFTQDATTLLKAVEALGGRFGMGMYILLIKGSKSSRLYSNYHKHPLHGSGKSQSDEWWKCIGRLLEREEYLTRSSMPNQKKFNTSRYNLSRKGEQFLRDVVAKPATKILLHPVPEMFKMLKLKPPPTPPEPKYASQPSTSSNGANPKRSLKLLQLTSKSKLEKATSKTESRDTIDSNNLNVESDENMVAYKLLIKKRNDIAASFDCMPYMVASNEALMKMAQMKPCSIKELRTCNLDGFTEVKIKKFGEQFVTAMQQFCGIDASQPQSKPQSIQDILSDNPLPNAKLGATAEVSYSMFTSGLTMQEIANKRGILPATVLSHLVDAMKMGYPIKMIDLNVTDEVRDTILGVIRSPPINSDISKLTPIKEACPPEITFNEIKVVVTYVQIRDHLARLNIPYVEFESPIENASLLSTSHIENTTSTPQNLSQLLNALAEESPVNQRKVNLGALSSKKSERRDLDSESDDSFVFTLKKKLKGNVQCISDSTLESSPTHSKKDDLSFLDSPPPSIGEKQKDNDSLEQSLLEDDFFDNVDVDQILQSESKITSQVANSSNNRREPDDDATHEALSSRINNKSLFTNTHTEIDMPSDMIKDFNTESPNKSAEICNSKSPEQSQSQNVIKKFHFKSKIPSHIQQDTKNLLSSLKK